jgi:putative phage-type endonuclease
MRGRRIGGSDAASVLGMNPWMSNVDLWRIKTWRTPQKDISDNPAVKFGTKAEPLLRKLFALDHPDLKVGYKENNMFIDDEIPFAHYSADGWLTDKDGRMGLLEIKTSTITSQAQRDKWQPKTMPSNYYVQLLQGFLVTGYEFAYLRAYLRYDFDGEFWAHIKEYTIERKDVLNDIKTLKEAEEKFWECVTQDKEPSLILPPL